MSTNTATAKHKRTKDKTAKEFKAEGIVEGRVPIKPQDEVDIQGAREILEMHSRRSLGKPYKVKVIGTDTRLILKRKSVVGSAPRELSLRCTDIYRFFIFHKDPNLVILVVADQTPGSRAYLLLKMKTDKEANRVCDIIKEGRKRLNAQGPSSIQPGATSPRQSQAPGGVTPEGTEVEMQENGKTEGKPSSYEVESESDHSEDEESDSSSGVSTKKSTHTSTPVPSTRGISINKSPETSSKVSLNEIEKTSAPEVHSAFPAMIENLDSDSGKGKESSPRSLPRTPLRSGSPSKKDHKEKRQPHRREPPLIEEMYVEPPRNWKVAQPIYARREAELREALLVDRYDEDWAVDVKLIKTDGGFGSRLSDSGNVYMFTAHHLVPENYGYFECSSSSDEELELKEKPLMKSGKGSTSRLVGESTSSDSDSEKRNAYVGMSRA